MARRRKHRRDRRDPPTGIAGGPSLPRMVLADVLASGPNDVEYYIRQLTLDGAGDPAATAVVTQARTLSLPGIFWLQPGGGWEEPTNLVVDGAGKITATFASAVGVADPIAVLPIPKGSFPELQAEIAGFYGLPS